MVAMGRTTYTKAHWPGKLRDLAHSPVANSPKVRKSLWIILQIVLTQYARKHGRQLGLLSREEIEDIVSEKSLDLFSKLESGKWNLRKRSDGEIVTYLSRIARNGVVDVLRHAGKMQETIPDEGHLAGDLSPLKTASPGELAQSRQFAEGVRDCSSRLESRARIAWFMRAFLDMKSKQIGAHPCVGRSPGAVDVLLKRTRESMKGCMKNKGFSTDEIPPGTFAQLWNSLNPELKEFNL